MKILETTLRDGSYAIDFKFTPKDTAKIASALEQVGFDLIEVGHGIGLHAKEMGKGNAAALDIEYLEAAISAIEKAKIGMFCIPGIARLEDIDIVADMGINFIRIGTNITELKGTQKYFERAKKYDLHVSSNLMKSYTVPAKEFGKYTRLAQKYGADIAVLVDSAGGLLPKDIEEYYKSSRDSCDIDLGFHGHNNLGLANANTLKAAELGASIVDTSLKGIGRSAGNAVTEMMIMIFKKLGYKLDIDEYKVMDLAEKYISPLIHNLKNNPISIISGYAQFHSSFMGLINKYSMMYNIDPRELIIRITEIDKVHADENLVKNLAKDIKHGKEYTTSKQLQPIAFDKFKKAKTKKEHKSQIEVLTDEIINKSKKTGKEVILNIVVSDIDTNNNFISEFIQESPLYITGSIEISDYEYIKPLIKVIKDRYRYILLDCSIKRKSDKKMLLRLIDDFSKTKLLLYNDLFIWAKSVVSILSVSLGNLINKKIFIYGNNNLKKHIVHYLRDFNSDIIDLNYQYCDAIISCDKVNNLTKNLISKFNSIGIVIDAKIDSIEFNCIEYLNDLGIKLLRPDMRSVIAGEILHQISNYNIVKKDIGRSTIQGYSVVSGGLIGRKNEIILDSINSPTQVIGIAQGNGKVKYSYNEKEIEIINKIQSYIDSLL